MGKHASRENISHGVRKRKNQKDEIMPNKGSDVYEVRVANLGLNNDVLVGIFYLSIQLSHDRRTFRLTHEYPWMTMEIHIHKFPWTTRE